MSGSYSSPCVPPPESEPNAEAADNALSSRSSLKNSSLSKARTLVRKPDSLSSGLESFKSNRRKSQERPELVPPRPDRDGEGVRFKKKALSKEEVVEMRGYVADLEKEAQAEEGIEVNSVAGTEKPHVSRAAEVAGVKENKKSKTEYFHPEDFQGVSESETLSEADRHFIASLKLKCQSVDHNNSLLQKRLAWLREEVEVHLERQMASERIHQQLQAVILQKDAQLQAQAAAHNREKAALQAQLHQRETQIQELKSQVADFQAQFHEEKDELLQELHFLRAEREAELEGRRACEDRISELEIVLSTLRQQSQEKEERREGREQTGLLERLLEESKYLRAENHVLARHKDEALRLQRELKRVSNERDTLKKKIIDSAKRRQRPFDDSVDSLFTLSEISQAPPPE